jgi:hypothetical protein
MREKIRVPHPNSPAGRNFNWADIGLPHPDSPAGRNFDYSKYLGMQHPNSPAGQRDFADSIVHAYGGLISHDELMPVFWKNIHDAIAMHSYTRVYGEPRPDDRRFDRYEEGNNFPDYPVRDGVLVMRYVETFLRMDEPGTIANRSHYGDLSIWHSMAPPGKYTNAEVLEMIVLYAKHWYEKSLVTSDLFFMGNIAHMISDSYSQAHVVRSARGIEMFQSYIPAEQS